MKALNGLRSQSHFELVLQQLIRHRVEVAIDFDVVVDMDAYLFTSGVGLGMFW